jgi:peptidoglycan hydrolase-like protein with peptidoglycan-binding domain
MWLAAVVLAGGGIAAWLITNDGEAGDGAAVPAPRTFEEVVVTDLIEEESYDATLGTLAADPIRTQLSGTVTWVAEPGSTLSDGDVLFEVDGQPVVLFEGNVPSYRNLASPELPTVTGIANRRNGTVTGVAEPGVFEQGDIVYWVDAEPVVLLYGDVPAYRAMRDLRTNMEGEDILQLEIALTDLGYDSSSSVTVDGEYTQNTEEMVERWQEDIGADADGAVDLGEVIFSSGSIEVTEFLIEPGDSIGIGQSVAELPDPEEEVEVPEGDDVLQVEAALLRHGFDAGGALAADGVWDEATEAAVVAWQESLGVEADGAVERGDIVFLPDAVRVLDQLAPVGTSVNAGATLLDISSADKLVTMDLPAADQGVVAAGDEVTVELPDGTEVRATVVEVATVATTSGNDTVFEVTIALDDPAAAASLDEAPVDVLIVTDSARGVLAVPVTALLVLSEGGYAVEVDAGGGDTRLVGVEPGFFADGLVEVQSSGLQFGDRVVVP